MRYLACGLASKPFWIVHLSDLPIAALPILGWAVSLNRKLSEYICCHVGDEFHSV